MATSPDRFAVVRAGFDHNETVARAGLHAADDSIRASALRALHRMNSLQVDDLTRGLTDSSHEVRRTAVEFAHSFDVVFHHMLRDDDVFVAEMTAWALGERAHITDDEMTALINAVESHPEPVVREASAAALGSIGDVRGLPAILKACGDKPAVRRRAILALAPFSGDDVDEALQHALSDKDWQVRQNAEILLSPRGS